MLRLEPPGRLLTQPLPTALPLSMSITTTAPVPNRPDTTTRAPEILAEIKHTLGDDAERFARSMARPIIVERELRARFENDDKVHAEKRGEAEQARADLLAKKQVKGMREMTWQLGPKPAAGLEKHGPASPTAPTSGTAKSANYSIVSSAQIAQVLGQAGQAGREREKPKFYFEDLNPELQKVLRVQLQKAGDVSAVIESTGGFTVYQADEKSAQTLSVSSVSIPKRSYEEWLAQQPE